MCLRTVLKERPFPETLPTPQLGVSARVVTASPKTGTDPNSPSSRPSAAKRLMKAMGLGARAPAAVPDKMRVYAIGDIHGCLSLLDELHAKISDDAANFPHEKH